MSIGIRQDLVDCEIAICDMQNLDYFRENFDQTNFKDGYVNWLYESEPVIDRVRYYVVEDQGAYFARLFNPRMYGIVTQDILARKLYPIVLDKKSVDARANYQNKMLNTYIDRSSQIPVSSLVSNNCVIGPQT